MAIRAIPQNDGSVRYLDDSNNEYSAEQIQNLPKYSITEKIGNVLTNVGNEFVSFAGRNLPENYQEERTNLLANAYDAYGTRNADDAARTAEAGRILNLDPNTFLGAKDDVQRAAKQAAMLKINSPDDWNTFVQENPHTASYLSNGANMAISYDDLKNLREQESSLNIITNSYELSSLQQQRAEIGNKLLGSINGLDNLNTEDQEKLVDIEKRIKSLQAKLPQSTWSINGILGGIAGMAPSAETGIKYGLGGAGIGAGIGLLGGGVGAIPGALSGFSQGFRVGFAKDFATSSMGNAYLNELQKGINPADAAKGAAVSGFGTALLSTAQIGKIIKLPEVTQAGIKGLATNVAEQAAIGAGLTATELAGQKVAERKPLDWGKSDAVQIAEGGVNMIPLALAMALPGHGYVALKNFGDIVDHSKTYQRSPELIANKINAQVEGTPLENVSIPAIDLKNYLQEISKSNPEEAKQIIDKIGVDPKEINEAVETGADIDIKLGNFEILPKQHREALLQDVKFGEEQNIKQVEEAYSRQAEEPTEAEQTINIAKDTGLDTTKFYSDAINESKSHAENVLSDRTKTENSPEFQKKLNSHLEEVKKDIESQIANDPLYQAADSLNFNLQLFGRKIKDVKEVARNYERDKLTDKQKAWFDTIAEQHGYSSGNELAKNIRNNKLKESEIKTRLEYAAEQFKKQELGDKSNVEAEAEISEAKLKSTAAEAETLRRMSEGEHITDNRSKREAEINSRWKDAETKLVNQIEDAKKAGKVQKIKDKLTNKIENLQQQLSDAKKQHAEEIKNLNQEQKQQFKDQKEQQKHDTALAKEWLKAESTSQKIARQAQVGIKTALEYAKTTLADKTVKDATAYSKYMQQARNAARQSERSYRKGLYEEASKWKNTEMVNHAFALEAMRLNKEFNKQDKYLKSVISKRKDLFKTNENFNQVGSILDRFGIGRKDYVPNSKTETLSQWSNRMDEMLGSVNISEWIYDESIRKNYKDLTMPEVKDLTDALKNIQKVANQEKISIAAKKGESLDELRIKQIEEMSIRPDTYKPTLEPSRFEKVGQAISNYYYQLQTFSTVISKLQGWKTFGSLEDFWIKPVHERANLESNRINQFKNEIEKVWSAYSKKERSKMANDRIYYDELGASATKMKLITMAMNLGNEGNSSKLFNTKPLGIDSSKPWSREVVMDLLSKNLDRRDWETVQKNLDLINTLWPDLAKFHAEMTGFEPQKVKATPFDVTLPTGEVVHMKGGYYPLEQDQRASLIAAQRASAESPLYTEQNPAWKQTTDTGHTKTRSNAQYAVSLDSSIMNRHIIDVVHDLHFRDLIADYRRMLNNADFQATVQSKIGPEGLKAFSDYIANVANGESYRNVGMTGIERIIDYLRKAGTKAAITFRVGVITQNAANIVLYPKAIEGFGTTDAAFGLIRHGLFNYLPKSALNWKAAKQVREEIYNISPYMRDRRQTPDYSLNDIQSNMFSKGSPISEFGIGLLSGSDDLIAVPMWKQAYEKQLAKTGDQQKAAYYADSLIKAVNGSGRKYDVAPIIRSKSMTDKIFSSFYSFMNTEFNRWVRETGMVTQGIENIPRFIGFAGSRLIIFTIMSDLLAGKSPDDKDNPVAYYGSKIASYPLQLLPVVRDIAPVIIENALGLHSFGYRPSIAFSEFENISNLASKTKSYLSGGKTTGQDVTEALAKTTAYGTGYPDQFNAWFFNCYDYLVNGMDPELQDIMKRRPKKERK